jgi:hypothetical protein
MPSESHSIEHVLLFQLHVLHHYWLDEGATVFDQLPQATRDKRLAAYDVRKLLAIQPTEATSDLLRGLSGVWKATSLGGLVAVPAATEVPDASVFEFTLRVVDPQLPAYTAYGLKVPSYQDVYDKANKRVLRYSAGAALYSNLTGCTRNLPPQGWLPFLSREPSAPQANDRVESIVNDGGTLKQLTSDSPNPAMAALGAALDLPAFATHADVPGIVAPAGIDGEPPAKGVQLPDGAPRDTWALVRIAAFHSADPELSCTVGGKPKPKGEEPQFQLRFKNRRSLWRRVRAAAPDSVLGEEGPLPLTHHGNAGTQQKPFAHAVVPVVSGTRVTNLVSKIYV